MAEQIEVKELEQVVVRFSGDSGDGMQLAGNIFSTVSASVGNGISTFPDYPADIRAPQGSLLHYKGVLLQKYPSLFILKQFAPASITKRCGWQGKQPS